MKMIDTRNIHLGGSLDPVTLDMIADLICGDNIVNLPKYRSSSLLTKLFKDSGINAQHDGTTRKRWVVAILEQLSPELIERVIMRLADRREYQGDVDALKQAVKALNAALALDGFKVTYDGNAPVLRFAEPFVLDGESFDDPPYADEEEFLKKRFSDDIDINDLGLDANVTGYLQARIDEVQSSPKDKVHLGTIFLLGSTLEGILLAAAIEDPKRFMSSKSAPKDGKTGAVRKMHDWKLNDLINVATEVGILSLDVKKFSHVLREFRNYIHPFEQMSKSFQPDAHTVDICWHVFKAAFNQLKSR